MTHNLLLFRDNMQGFFNYVERQLCEYQSIFPTVARLMDHILFVNGTGLEVDSESGMIYNIYDKKKQFINTYPKMTEARWKKLLEDCYEKERKFAERFANGKPIDETELAEDCAKYKQVAV